jgi:hypothetical protein
MAMVAVLLLALLAVVLFGVGFLVHVLWYVAIAVAVIWVLGFVFSSGHQRRWYRW